MRRQIVIPLIVASVFLGTSPAASQYAAYPDGREPAYYVTFYSDATHTTVVGNLTPECGFSFVQYHLTGQHSYYSVDEFAYYCPAGGPE
jgi:hypothetical protein